MRTASLAAAVVSAPSLAQAHTGHWGEVAGHDHWIALGALGALGVAGVIAALAVKSRKRRDEEGKESREDAEEAEA